MNEQLSKVQGVTERLATLILSDYGGDVAQLAQADPVHLADAYNGVGLVTANRIKAWAAAAQQQLVVLTDAVEQVAARAEPEPDATDSSGQTDQAEVTEEQTVPPASTRVERIRDASDPLTRTLEV